MLVIRIAFLSLLGIIITNSLVAQSEVDDLRLAINAAVTVNERTEKLLELAEIYNYIRLDSALQIANRAVGLAENSEDEWLLGKAYEAVAKIHYVCVEDDSAAVFIKKAIEHYQRSAKTELEQMQLLSAQTQLLNINRKAEQMVKNGFTLLEYYRKENLPLKLIDAYDFLSSGYRMQLKTAELSYYDSLMLNLSAQHHSSLVHAYHLCGYANALRFNDQLEKADSVLVLVKDLIDDTYCPETRGDYLLNYGIVHLDMDKLDSALAKLEEGLEVVREGGTKITEALLIGNIATIYEKRKQYQKAIALYRQMLTLVADIEDPWYRFSFLELLGNSYAQIQQYDSAYHYIHKTLLAERDLVQKQYDDQLADYNVQYETAEKEAQLKVQEARIEQQQTILWLTGGIILLMALGGAGLYYLTRILKRRNTEKDYLVKEIHHRVKNNLQILSSLLYLQSRHIKDEQALSAVKEGQNRVDAMGLIHQKLYMGDNMAAVNVRDYVQDLGEALLDTLSSYQQQIELEYNIVDLSLDVDTAIPLGLIINELITNSLKYAFSHQNSGQIKIDLFTNDEEHLVLRVSDEHSNDAIVPTEKNSTGFGSNLVEILSEKLRGVPITKQLENGYQTEIVFKKWSEGKVFQIT